MCRRISVYNLELRHRRFLSHRVQSIIRYRPVTRRLYIGFLWLKIREQVADSYQQADEPSRNFWTKEAVFASQDGLCWLELVVNSSEVVEAKCADSVVRQTTYS